MTWWRKTASLNWWWTRQRSFWHNHYGCRHKGQNTRSHTNMIYCTAIDSYSWSLTYHTSHTPTLTTSGIINSIIITLFWLLTIWTQDYTEDKRSGTPRSVDGNVSPHSWAMQDWQKIVCTQTQPFSWRRMRHLVSYFSLRVHGFSIRQKTNLYSTVRFSWHDRTLL